MSEQNLPEEKSPQQLGGGRRLTVEQWEDAKSKYKSGHYTLADLSALFHISSNALHKRFKKNRVTKGSDAKMYAERIAEAEAAARAEVAAKDEKALRTKASNLKTFILSASEITAKKLMAQMAKNSNSQDLKPLSAISEDAKAAKEVTITLKNIADIIEKVVPSEKFDPDDVPELQVSELTDEDIAALRSQQELEDEQMMSGQLSESDFGISEDDIVDTSDDEVVETI